MSGFRVALAQINPTVGDIQGNLGKMLNFVERARQVKADLVVFPELAVTGYPPEDLLLKSRFVSDSMRGLAKLEKRSHHIGIVAGYVRGKGKKLYNSAAFISEGKTRAVCDKTMLPNYGVFDEKRYFEPGHPSALIHHKGIRFGISICEDIWHKGGPCAAQAKEKADLLVNINASPYNHGKHSQRLEVLRKFRSYIAYVNMVGGQDELIFDGGSIVLDSKGKVMAMGHQFEEDLIVVDLPVKKGKSSVVDLKTPIKKVHVKPLSKDEEIYSALKLAVHDYVTKNGFEKVVIGLSGGIDSGLTACIAADALGPENVACVFLPSKYTLKRSSDDAVAMAKNLNVELMEIKIESLFDSYLFELSEAFKGTERGIAEENLQARIRGSLLMALSNKFGWLVLTTGNKSEMSVGYATLYGDMAGGFAVLKDIPKTLVYELARYRNSIKEVIPSSMLEREPTAELRPNQRDTDTLPPYDVLDAIMNMYVVENRSQRQIIAKGFASEDVKKVVRMIDRSEYKRRQSPPGPKITHRAFGKDWRLPVTNLYKG